eukprot:350122_1
MTQAEINENDLWVANFTCSKARNGMVEIVIKNLHILYNRLATIDKVNLDDPAEDILIVHSQFSDILHHHSTCEYIENVNISQHSQIYIKFPMYFNSYNVSISIQGHSHVYVAQNTRSRCRVNRFPISEPQVLHIPSFLSSDNYTIDEIIRIRHPITHKMINGRINDVLNDNMYAINYTNSTNGDIKHINLPISQMYAKATCLTYTLKWENICNRVNMNLYFCNLLCESDTKAIICAIFDFFEHDRYFGDAYDTWLIDYGHYDKYYFQTLTNFLVRSICEFMFEPEYQYNADCVFDKCNQIIKFDNVRKYYLTQYERIIANCDCCGSPLSMWDFAFFCNATKKMRHQTCIDCVSWMFDSWNELQPLLYQLLKNELNGDCIRIIVDYVVGRIFMKCCGNDNSIYEQSVSENKKRLLTVQSFNLEPALKKRRLNNQ